MNKKLLFIGFLSLLIGTLLLSTTLTSYAAEEIYVDVNHGSDQDGDGSQSNPYKTITKAVGIADSSNTHTKIYLASGVYSSNSGENFPLTLDNIDLIGNPDDPSQVEVSGEMNLSSGEVTGIQFYQNLTAEKDVLVKQNIFSGIPYGVKLFGASTVIDNKFRDNTYAIDASNYNGPIEVTNNVFTNNNMAISGSFGGSKVSIKSNQVDTGSYGFDLYLTENHEVVIRNNDITVDRRGVGLEITASGESLVEGNRINGLLIYGQASSTIDLGGGTLGSSGNNNIQYGTYSDYIVEHTLPAYSGTIYAKNNTWKDSSGSEIQPPEVLEGPADTEHFYIKNTGNKIRFSGTEDTTPPSVTIDTAPSGTIQRRDVTFEWTGSDDRTATSDLVYSYILAGHDTSWSNWTSSTSKSYTDLPDGSYTFKVEAKDEAGNITGTPPTASFTVDLGEPDISFTEEGWKMIGFPYPVDWSQASFSNPSSFANDGAGNVRLVVWDPNDQKYLNHYSDSSYVTSAWNGYWIYVSSATSENPATISVSETSKSPSASSLRTALPASVENKELEYPPKPEGAESSQPIRIAAYSYQQENSVKFAVLNADKKVESLIVSIFKPSGEKLWKGEDKGKELMWSTGNLANGVYLYRASIKIDGNWTDLGVQKLLVIG